MSIPYFQDEVRLISKLADKPNETNGLTADQLKARFDEAPALIKSFINNTIIPALQENYITDTEAETLLAELGASSGENEKLFEILSALTAAIVLAKNASNIIEGILPMERGGTGNAAGRAESLSTDAGDESTPVFFEDGKPVACGTLGLDTTGKAASAEKLASTVNLQVNLASNDAVGFDGSEDATLGATGILPVTKGGTGASAASGARTNLAVAYKPVLLWSGSLSSGSSVTIATSGGSSGCTGAGNVSDYRFIIILSGEKVPMLIELHGGWATGGNLYRSGVNLGAYYVDVTQSTNKLTINSFYRNITSGSSASTEPITAIYGLVKNSDIITA